MSRLGLLDSSAVRATRALGRPIEFDVRDGLPPSAADLATRRTRVREAHDMLIGELARSTAWTLGLIVLAAGTVTALVASSGTAARVLDHWLLGAAASGAVAALAGGLVRQVRSTLAYQYVAREIDALDPLSGPRTREVLAAMEGRARRYTRALIAQQRTLVRAEAASLVATCAHGAPDAEPRGAQSPA